MIKSSDQYNSVRDLLALLFSLKLSEAEKADDFCTDTYSDTYEVCGDCNCTLCWCECDIDDDDDCEDYDDRDENDNKY